jgi:hypothetical protein
MFGLMEIMSAGTSVTAGGAVHDQLISRKLRRNEPGRDYVMSVWTSQRAERLPI